MQGNPFRFDLNAAITNLSSQPCVPAQPSAVEEGEDEATEFAAVAFMAAHDIGPEGNLTEDEARSVIAQQFREAVDRLRAPAAQGGEPRPVSALAVKALGTACDRSRKAWQAGPHVGTRTVTLDAPLAEYLLEHIGAAPAPQAQGSEGLEADAGVEAAVAKLADIIGRFRTSDDGESANMQRRCDDAARALRWLTSAALLSRAAPAPEGEG